jgi:hypothetical protein
MALAALVVSIVSVLGTLLYYIVSFRRAGWDLDVIAWIDIRPPMPLIHAAVTNTGRQGCVVSKIRFFFTDLSDGQSKTRVFDHQAAPQPIAPSATFEVTRELGMLPDLSTIEAWAWTAGRPYKSHKWTCDLRDLDR